MKTSTAGKISTSVTISVAIATLAVAGLSGCASGPQYYGTETGARGAYAPDNHSYSYYSSGYENHPSRHSGYYPGAIYIY